MSNGRVDLRRFFNARAREAKDGMARRLRGRKGVDGQFLPNKKRPNARPLGFGKSRGGIPALLRRGRVRVFRNGFTVFYRGLKKVGWFHRGYPPQNRPRRPVAGIPKREQRRILEQAAVAAAKQVTAMLRRGGRR